MDGQRSTSLRRSARAAAMAGALAASLGAAELAARALHGGAWPFLNLYRADARYGVRLAPSAVTRVRSRGGRITEVRTNALGFRGPEWRPAAGGPVPGRVLLLGDSQAFGYQVAWERSLAPELERALGGGEVLDAAVPSWGPPEYLRALDDLAPTYRPSHVVFVANLANDWFEATVDNARRTTARDGWAARETGAPPAIAFPGRELLLGRSHLVFAARELWERGARGGQPPAEPARRLLRDLPTLARSTEGHRSRLAAPLLAAAARCRALGCSVVAVALPIDVMAHPGEWAKYRTPPLDLAPAEALVADLVADAREAGLATVDLLPVLRAASPGAFLPDDDHLSPAGHRAAARAIARAIAGEQPIARAP